VEPAKRAERRVLSARRRAMAPKLCAAFLY
jgi:hypothetical protein